MVPGTRVMEIACCLPGIRFRCTVTYGSMVDSSAKGNTCRRKSRREIPDNPYAEDPHDLRCVSFSPNGDVLGGNVYERDIMEIIGGYVP